MTPEEINVAIAEACGYSTIICSIDGSKEPLVGIKDGKPFQKVPNYCHDLNAMHEAENSKPYLYDLCVELHKILIRDWKLMGKDTNRFSHEDWFNAHRMATAMQRAEAFLRTIGKWREEV